MRHEILLVRTAQQMQIWGEALGRLLLPGDVIALEGDLGAGKTTLTKGIAAGMGVQDEVTSPTFTLVHEYRGRIPIFHLDPYRLERPDDLFDLGFDEYLERAGVTVIEWADRLGSFLPAECLTVKFEIIDTPKVSDIELQCCPDCLGRSEAQLPDAIPERDNAIANCLTVDSSGGSDDSEAVTIRRLTVVAKGDRYERLLRNLSATLRDEIGFGSEPEH